MSGTTVMVSRYKYLNDCPEPVNLHIDMYDLVEDFEFCQLDQRIPLILVAQYGVSHQRVYIQIKKTTKELSKYLIINQS
jgi:hypothetical protein